ncbi:MAG: hypothetical protein E6J41_29660 [Chloroflexi bacterium]|nr:MAG: hypothetical protein E6J41_29660 [Chloroflexota bacterium]
MRGHRVRAAWCGADPAGRVAMASTADDRYLAVSSFVSEQGQPGATGRPVDGTTITLRRNGSGPWGARATVAA